MSLLGYFLANFFFFDTLQFLFFSNKMRLPLAQPPPSRCPPLSAHFWVRITLALRTFPRPDQRAACSRGRNGVYFLFTARMSQSLAGKSWLFSPLLLCSDVLQYLSTKGSSPPDQAAAPAPAKAAATEPSGPVSQRKGRRSEPYTDKPASNMRKVIATRLTASKVGRGG